MAVERNLISGSLAMLVLKLLSERDMYGYEIVQSIAQYTEIAEGTVYPILRRLTSEDYFKTYLKESSSGPARKYYSIIPAGREFLETLKKDWFEFAGIVEILLRGEAL